MAKGNPYGNVISSPIISFNGGLDTRLPENAAPNTFNEALNVSVTSQGLLTQRPGLKAWLPDAVGTVYQVYPAIYNGTTYYFICDDGLVKFCKDGDTAWTVCGGPNAVTTGVGIRYQFVMAESKLYVANGQDTSRYIDLTTMDMVLFEPVTNPTNAPTAAAFGSGLTYATSSGGSTPYPIYYSITFNGDGVGQTMNSPILSSWVSVDRTNWVGNNTYGLTITRNNTTPANATSWNIWVAIASNSGTISNDDMLLMVSGLDINSTVFNDDGTVQPNLNAGTAPSDNSTQGFTATYGTEINGTVFLWGIVGNEYALMIGGTPGNAFDFTPTNGGYTLLINQGTNYFPTNLVSFRNSQGTPGIVMFYSNAAGVSIQTQIEQSTVNYGNYSFVVWGSIDQGRTVPAGASPYAVFPYDNSVYFPTISSVMELTTRPTTLAVLVVNNISIPIADLWQSINADQLPNVIGAGIDNRIFLSCAVNGFTYNNMILVYDFTDPNNPRWYPWNITQQWFGIISPSTDNFFMYVTQDNHFFKLEQGSVAQDEDSNGVPTPFAFGATGPLTGSNQDHSAYLALVQAVPYFVDVVGNIDVSVTYSTASPSGLVTYKTRSKTINGPEYLVSTDGNWSDYAYQFLPAVSPLLGWGGNPVFNISDTQQPAANYRPAIQMGSQVVNESQWSFSSDANSISGGTLRSWSYEGVEIGVKADIQ